MGKHAKVIAAGLVITLLATGCGPKQPTGPDPSAPVVSPPVDNDSFMPVSDRIVAVSTLWSEANYMFAHWDTMPEEVDWDAAYRAAIDEVMAAEDGYAYLVALERFAAVLGDAHTRVNPPSGTVPYGGLPIRIRHVEGRYIVSAANPTSGVTVGSELICVDGRPTAEYLEAEIGPLVPCRTPLARQKYLCERFWKGRTGEELRLTVASATGDEREVTLTYGLVQTKDFDQMPYYSGKIDNDLYDSNNFTVTKYVGNVARVHIKSFGNTSMVAEFYSEVLPILLECEGVILDLRNGGGGNSGNGDAILRAFVELPVGITRRGTQVHIAQDVVIAGSYELLMTSQDEATRKQFEETIASSALYVRGKAMRAHTYYAFGDDETDIVASTLMQARNHAERQARQAQTAGETASGAQTASGTGEQAARPLADMPLVMLVDETVISSGETITYTARRAGVPIVGSCTAGTTGENYQVPLTRGWRVSFTAVKVLGDDGFDLFNNGIRADVYVEPTWASVSANLDNQLLAALEHLNTLM